ncbi:MAG: DUF1284 domain-containing protein [Nanoarchaeota archaeon]|nr:DUF1284 domain-containing protein [Nanoarchaeota archaeon]
MKKIRAHHLICFSRHHDTGWYSKDYEKNFKAIFKDIIKNPNQKIKIKRDCEDICKKCPYVKNKTCNKPSKYKINHWVKVMDNKTLRLIKIKPDTIHTAKELLKLVSSKITNKDLRNICKGCEYLPNCLRLGINKSVKKIIK